MKVNYISLMNDNELYLATDVLNFTGSGIGIISVEVVMEVKRSRIKNDHLSTKQLV